MSEKPDINRFNPTCTQHNIIRSIMSLEHRKKIWRMYASSWGGRPNLIILAMSSLRRYNCNYSDEAQVGLIQSTGMVFNLLYTCMTYGETVWALCGTLSFITPSQIEADLEAASI